MENPGERVCVRCTKGGGERGALPVLSLDHTTTIRARVHALAPDARKLQTCGAGGLTCRSSEHAVCSKTAPTSHAYSQALSGLVQSGTQLGSKENR